MRGLSLIEAKPIIEVIPQVAGGNFEPGQDPNAPLLSLHTWKSLGEPGTGAGTDTGAGGLGLIPGSDSY